MDTREAGKRGGESRSEKKRAASAKNLAKARATIRAALNAYKAKPVADAKSKPVLLTGNVAN